MEKQIFAIGGGSTPEAVRAHLLSLTGKKRPKVLLVPTASAEDPAQSLRIYDAFGDGAQLSRVEFFPWPPESLRELTLAQDLILVGGGNTANMLAIWRVHGFDAFLREAWEQGVVLSGSSAGMICWFEAGVTDSFGPQLGGMDCLGFVPGSACPHYDGEERRRPRYRELIDGGFPEGVAADDGVGIHYVGTEIAEIVTCRPGAAAYHVTRDGEEKLETRELA